jgi:hypothetical protein
VGGQNLGWSCAEQRVSEHGTPGRRREGVGRRDCGEWPGGGRPAARALTHSEWRNMQELLLSVFARHYLTAER